MKRPIRSRVKSDARAPTADDVFCDLLRAECAKAIVKQIKGNIDTRRALKSLTLSEFEGLAEACTARWIQMVSKRLAEGLLPPETENKYHHLLLGG